MNNLVLLPKHVSFWDWIIDLNRSIPSLNVPVPKDKDEEWQKSAMLLIQLNQKSLSQVVLPLHHVFPMKEDWKRWAYFFIQNVSNL